MGGLHFRTPWKQRRRSGHYAPTGLSVLKFNGTENTMSIFVALVALFMIGIGLYGLLAPQRLAGFIALWRSDRGLWTAAALRILFAVALWLAAPASKAPLALSILAGITLAAGIALPVLGLARFTAVLDWWQERPVGLQRAWLGLAAGLGVFLLWAVAG
jgi:hypothetical protein